MATDTRTAKVLEIGNGLEIWKAHTDDLREQDKNARAMSRQQFERLVSNIESGGRLESLPFCALREDGTLGIISGHHRVRAARAANVTEVFVLVDVSGLSRSQVVSKQLAHNAISGEDDDDMIVQLFEEMDNVDDMIASGIDPKELGLYDPLETTTLEKIAVDFDGRVIALTFLPTQIEDIDRACDMIPADTKKAYLISAGAYEKFVQTLEVLGRKCEIRNVAAVVSKMCDVAMEWAEHFEVDEDGKVDETKPKADKIAATIERSTNPAGKAMAALLQAQGAGDDATG